MTRGTLERSVSPARNYSIKGRIPAGQFGFFPIRLPTWTMNYFPPDCSEALALSGDRHPGIVNVDQAPAALFFLIELCFPAVSRERVAIFSELGSEIPIELGPGSVSVNMNGNVMNTQFAFRKGFAHQPRVDILLDLLETVLVSQRVDKGGDRRIQPDLRGESRIRVVD